MVGLPDEEAKRYWRALGFVDVPDEEIAFSDADVAALGTAAGLIREGFADPRTTFAVTRIAGQSMARIADALTGFTYERVAHAADAEYTQADALAERASILPTTEAFLNYAFRRHLAAAAKRRVIAGDDALSMTVGFCDLVGFTELARRVEETELADVVERFESVAYDVIAANGGRLVKMIGDEVMFVAPSAVAGASIALQLSEEHGRDPAIPDCRIGLAFGPVLPREGDYFGETVNLASRIQGAAQPRTVLISEECASALHDEPSFEVRRIPQRYLKGVGRTKLWVLRRAERV
jgi:adenylate cyclase